MAEGERRGSWTLSLFRLFSLPARSTLLDDGREVRVFDPELSDLQRKVLRLIGAPAAAYRSRS